MGMMNTRCNAGVELQRVRDESTRPFKAPCFAPEIKHLCPHHAPYTEAEITEHETAVKSAISSINAFATGDSRVCPTCGSAIQTITLYEKREPETYSLYTHPCNHRHGLWRTAPDWAVNEGIVHVIPLEVQNNDDDDYTEGDVGQDGEI